jgi:malate dehydrogenase (oxaloacetate-decarboxylating)
MEAIMDIGERAVNLHVQARGKIEVVSTVPVKTMEDLSLAYTPGVATPCKEIERDPGLVYAYTRKWNMVAVVTDGSAVLGLGNIGAKAALPVMEGKAVLFKAFGDVDAFPICLPTQDADEIVTAVKWIAPVFGGINLEDISAPRCFEIEARLKEELDIPVFHDDQHGTAVVTLAAMLNALRITGKKPPDLSIVINGAGAAGVAVSRLLLSCGVTDIVLCDRKGALAPGREGMNDAKESIAALTNPQKKTGVLSDVIRGADVFIGVSAPGVLTPEMVRTMAADPCIFAMANPTPEIFPEEAVAAGARIVGTGRSDFANQINNVLAFPGIFRGVLDVRASDISEGMKIAAARAIAGLVSDHDLGPSYILPAPFDGRVGETVAAAVAQAARDEGLARAL